MDALVFLELVKPKDATEEKTHDSALENVFRRNSEAEEGCNGRHGGLFRRMF